MKQENRCTNQIRVLSGFSQIPKICWILVCEILSPKMFKQILVSLGVWLSISLNAQVINSQSLESVERNKRNTSFNLEEIKVRWKKAALENCPGVPCITITVPGAPTGVVATAGNASASVAFVAPTNNGGSVITGYTVTSNPGGVTVSGGSSPINVTGLTNNTAYTFTVVATNSVGNSVASAASTAVTPTATITVPGAPTGVVATAGNASASVAFVAPTNNGGSVITGYTVTSNPGGVTVSGGSSPINVTGLTNNTAYTFTVVATNAVGNSVASAASTAVTPGPPPFTCGTSTVTDVDGNVYNTVAIGTQCWTKQNLKVTKYNDGTLIPDLTTSTSNPWAPSSGARTEYVATGVSSSDYVGTFGYLYNWYAVTDSRKLCPDGWHVPTDAEWTIMIQTLDPSQAVNSGNVSTFIGSQSTTAGTELKSTVTNTTSGSGLGWNPGSPGTNTSDFSGLPGGYRFGSGSFSSIRVIAYFWSADDVGGGNPNGWIRVLASSIGNVNRAITSLSVGASVRCLKN